jgi:hypothetical protein
MGGGTTWARGIGSTLADQVVGVVADSSGNTYVSGNYHNTVDFGGTSKTSAGGYDIFVAKYSPTNVLLWVQSFGGASDDLAANSGIALDTAGNVVVVGKFAGVGSFGGASLTPVGSYDIVVFKLTSAGANVWGKSYGSSGADAGLGVATDASNNVWITGYIVGTVDFGGGPLTPMFGTNLDLFLVKLAAADGAHLLSRHFPNSGNFGQGGNAGLAVDSSSNVYLTASFSNAINLSSQDFSGNPNTGIQTGAPGRMFSANGLTDVVLAKFSSAAAFQWAKQIGNPSGQDLGYDIAVSPAGDVVATGIVNGGADLGSGSVTPAIGGDDAFIVAYTTSGGFVWGRLVGTVNDDTGSGVALDGAGNMLATGQVSNGTAQFGGSSFTASSRDGYLAKYVLATGNLTWVKQLGGTGIDQGTSVTGGAGIPLVGGFFNGTGTFDGHSLTSNGVSDGFTLRTAP